VLSTLLYFKVVMSEGLTRIYHEHCDNLLVLQKGQDISHKKVCQQIYTVFTEGQSRQRHLLQSFGNEHSLTQLTINSICLL